MKNKLTAYPDLGQAIRNKTPYVLIKPVNHKVNDSTTLTDAW